MQPPKWADRFLAWYCNPDLLEEIQGDVHELYFHRLKQEGKTAADWKYAFDVIRFFRWSNIKRSRNEFTPRYFRILWSLNVKIALRNAFRNKLTFSVKMLGLSLCLAFALMLTAFVIQEFTFDQHHKDHERIFRIGCEVNIQGAITNFAVSPVVLAQGLAEEVPDVENIFTVLYAGKPSFLIDNETFGNINTLIVSQDFLNVLRFDFIHGNASALNDAYKIVLTESTARKLYGAKEPLGEIIDMEWAQLEVTAVIRNPPENSHLKFDALISWDTYDVNERWDNINAYTYIKLSEEADPGEAKSKIIASFENHHEDIMGNRSQEATESITVSPIIENISQIHLSEPLDEDIAIKRKKTNLYILIAVIALFFITGLINFLNLSLAELTANLRKIRILQVFGGATASHGKVVITSLLLVIGVTMPLTFLLCYAGMKAASFYFAINIDPSVMMNPSFVAVSSGFVLVFMLLTKLNTIVLTGTRDLVNSLKGKIITGKSSLQARGWMVAAQLSFSMVMIALILIIVDQFHYIDSTDKGFEDKNTIVIRMPHNYATTEAFQEAVRNLNGVEKTDGGTFYLDNIETQEFFEIETTEGNKNMLVPYISCGYDYLDLLNIEIVSGRNFDPSIRSDDKGAYIINEAAARKFGWKDPIGQTIRGPFGTDRDEGKVIGVVKDFNFSSLHEKVEPLIIFLVNEGWGIRYVYVKTKPLSQAGLVGQIENEYKKFYPEDPMKWEYLDSRYKSLYREDHEVKNIFETGLIISILVSCMGIFSISALLVVIRTREMGIRKVVGATQFQLFAHHISSFGKYLLMAVFIAWPATYYLADYWLNNFAYHISLSTWYFVLPGLATLLIIVATSAVHGIKSSMVNPVEVLRHE